MRQLKYVKEVYPINLKNKSKIGGLNPTITDREIAETITNEGIKNINISGY